MRTVYATQFDLLPEGGTSNQDLFAEVFGRVRRWVEDGYQRKWQTDLELQVDGRSHSPLQDHTLKASLRAAGDTELFTLEWAHPADNDSSAAWVTECHVAKNQHLVQIGILLHVSTLRIVLRPMRFNLGRPRLVMDLLEGYPVQIDGWKVPQAVEHVGSPDVQPHVQEVLLNTERNLPVLMISPDVLTGKFAVDSEELFKRLQGFAHVAVLADKWAAFKLTDIVGKQLSCYRGAIRIYWPEFALDHSPFRHRLFFPHSIQRHNDEGFPLRDYLFRSLAAVATYRYTEGPVIRGARRAIAAAENQRVVELRDQVNQGTIEKEQLETQFLEEIDKVSDLEKERDKLRDELDAQKAAWAQMQQFQESEAIDDGEEAEEVEEPIPETVKDVVEAAMESAPDAVVYLDSALKSANESPYKNAERLAELLEAIDLVASEWKKKKGVLGQNWVQAFEALGFEYKDSVSPTAKGKWKSDYEFMYDGKKQLFEQHITLGSGQPDTCLSVHWYRDDKKKLLVIGHCGRHLTNTSS